MKNITIFILLLSCSLSAFSLSNKQFDKLVSQMKDNRFTSVKAYLDNNEQSQDPDYYSILLNYAFLQNKNTDPTSILANIEATRDALQHFPNRLDIHIGVLAVLETTKQWELLATHLVTILKTSKDIDNQWTWGRINSMQGNLQGFMIQNIIPRTAVLSTIGTPTSDLALEKVSRALIEHYPDLIHGYTSLGNLYLSKKDYVLSETLYKKALSLAPNDTLLIANIDKIQQLKVQ